LIVFGVGFLVLFAIVAIAEGVGDPSVPSGDVAVIEGVSGDLGEVTQAEFDHALLIAAKQAGEKKAPKPGTAKYDETKENALNFVLEGIWIQGLAEERGVEVSDKEVAKQLKKVKSENFQSDAEFRKFLKESGFNRADVRGRVRIELLSEAIQEELKEEAPSPSQSQVEAYYEAAKATQFTQPPTRDVRLVINKNRNKAKAARQALTRDNSAKNWKKVAKKYSEDPTTKENGGLQEGVQKGILEEPLNEAVFNTPEGRVEGPIEAQRGFTVFEVVNSTPESVQELKAVESQIQSTLKQREEQEFFASFVAEFGIEWSQRTFCAPSALIERCSNYEDSGHPAAAPEACYEANPKGGPPEACPAPVNQLVPALPGTVTPLEPKGKPLAQRPRPKEEEGAEGAQGVEGLPEGTVPPTEGAPPTGE